MYTILFPSDYFNCNKIDAELEQEYKAAIKAGFNVMLFDYSSCFELIQTEPDFETLQAFA